ncbi:Clan CA, family C19, ubiquitin hydrolase-like cysteine peptidase [Histomonas meleagridis]|uniref:Clan CA, family C19, ubiquitin hydrolase-like cysteine peptidase n=1 Tax=Histomonas meleagridis TaxID=135588 RepID=UPI0035598D53|nr:Clan CA, family C19, ubiquitin hydrolase-like cysteine peptidase [Histomonas meleagridis]KAH0800582.1 Clan CA, family C19, ubiquitin hydrolase-like cysteine peptidase [Histomonas meleagridis]
MEQRKDEEKYYIESIRYSQTFKNECKNEKGTFLQVQRLLWEKSLFPSRFPPCSTFLCSQCSAKTRDLSFCLQCGRTFCGSHFQHNCQIPYYGVDILTQQLFVYMPSKGRRFIFDSYIDHLILSAKLAVIDGLPLTADLEPHGSIFPIRRAPMPLFNLGNTCWLNSILQCFVVNPLLQKWFLSSSLNITKIDCVEAAIHQHLCRLFLSNFGESSFSISEFVYCIWCLFPSFANQQQSDAHEFFMELRAKLDNYYQQTFETTVFSQVFNWKFTVIESCSACGQTKTYLEDATDLILCSTNCSDIMEALSQFMETSSPKPCSSCGGKDCKKQFYFNTLPPVLTISMTRIRSTDPPIPIEEDLYLGDFVDADKSELNDVKYSLSSIVVRPGSGDLGHYWANVQQWGQWYKCDDYTITPITISDTCRDDACLLFYTRNGLFQ